MAVVRAGNFNGTSSKMSVANYTGNPTSFSVAMWVYLAANQVQRIFFENYQVTGPKGWGVGVSDTLTNKLKFYLNPNTLTSATALSNTTWYYVVFTYDGTTAKIYLNGSSTPDATLVTALSYGTTATNNNIGALSGTSQWFNGSLAAVGYWSKVLSTTEMANLYNLGYGVNYSELSGTLLTSLGSYHDFNIIADLGHDSSTNVRNYTATNVTRSVISTITYSAAVLADSPVSYWKTDQTTGPHITDSVDGNTLGQVNTSTLNQAGPGTLKAIDFGPGGWLAAETIIAPNIEITGNITLEAWVKLNSTPTANARSIILDKGYSSNTNPYDDYCLFAEGTGGAFGVSISIGTTLYSAEGSSTPVAGVWYHLCGTYDGTNLKFYENGVLQQTTAASGAIRNDGCALAVATAIRGSLTSNYFNGLVSNIAIYNTALSLTQVSAHYGTVVLSSVVVSQVGMLVVSTADPSVRVSQAGILVVAIPNPYIRVSQLGLTTVYTASPNVRVSQLGLLTIYTVTPKVRDSQIGVLVIATGSPKVRDSQIGALVVCFITPYLDFTITTPTVAIGAGTPSRAISLTLSGFNMWLASTASFALSDGGAGGVFFPASPITIASGNGPGTVTQFVYTAPVSATGTIILTATCTGGLTATKTLSLPIGVSTIFVRDSFTDTLGTLLTAHTPEVGSAWVKQTNGSAGVFSLNGVGGLYQSTGAVSTIYASYANSTPAATVEYDAQATCVVKDNTAFFKPFLTQNVNFGSATLNMYTMEGNNDPSIEGWYGRRFTNNSNFVMWGPVNTPTVTPGTYVISRAIRIINGSQYHFYYVDGVLKTTPIVENSYNSRYIGVCTNSNLGTAQTTANGVQIGDLYGRNADWVVPTPTATTNASCLLMGM